MKKNIVLSICCLFLIIITCIYNDKISNKIVSLLDTKPYLVINDANEYAKNKDYLFIQKTNNFSPYGYQDLMNIIYTVLDNGYTNFTFYCPTEYESCISDIEKITNDTNLLTTINNYIHPFNNFETIKTVYEKTTGEVNLEIEKIYSKEEIAIINQKVDNIIKENINSTMTDYEKIKTIHDYIINNTTYDIKYIDTGINVNRSNTAYGTLIKGYSVCNGYSDAMAIFLFRFNINNYKIATQKHIWNAIYVNNKWLHADLTWDDPSDENKVEYLITTYFLIDNDELSKNDKGHHSFDKSIYLEFK